MGKSNKNRNNTLASTVLVPRVKMYAVWDGLISALIDKVREAAQGLINAGRLAGSAHLDQAGNELEVGLGNFEDFVGKLVDKLLSEVDTDLQSMGNQLYATMQTLQALRALRRSRVALARGNRGIPRQAPAARIGVFTWPAP